MTPLRIGAIATLVVVLTGVLYLNGLIFGEHTCTGYWTYSDGVASMHLMLIEHQDGTVSGGGGFTDARVAPKPAPLTIRGERSADLVLLTIASGNVQTVALLRQRDNKSLQGPLYSTPFSGTWVNFQRAEQ